MSCNLMFSSLVTLVSGSTTPEIQNQISLGPELAD